MYFKAIYHCNTYMLNYLWILISLRVYTSNGGLIVLLVMSVSIGMMTRHNDGVFHMHNRTMILSPTNP